MVQINRALPKGFELLERLEQLERLELLEQAELLNLELLNGCVFLLVEPVNLELLNGLYFDSLNLERLNR